MIKADFSRNVRYELMFGRDAVAALRECPVAYLPCGCLERHGDHLPMGLDVIKAHGLCCLAAQCCGGVTFPPHYYSGIHQMDDIALRKYTGEWGNIYNDASAESSLSDSIVQMAMAGAKIVVLYSGHYPECQREMIKRIADRFNDGSGLYVIPACERFVIDGDHAGVSETSLMLYLQKELTAMDRIADINWREHGWQECNSPEKASAAEGERQAFAVIEYLRLKITEGISERKLDINFPLER